MNRRAGLSRIARIGVPVLLFVLVVQPAMGQGPGRAPSTVFMNHVSQSVAIRYWLQHPDRAPATLRQRFEAAARAIGKARAGWRSRPVRASSVPLGDRFNGDVFGLPQNEESITVCGSDTSVVLGGTNDYRGLLDPDLNFTGWHFSNTGGDSLTNEGLLPAVPFPIAATSLPSGGDPVDVADAGCNLFAGSLAYDPFDLDPNGVVVYRTDPATLASCPGGADPSCWPTSKVIAEGAASHFLDKEWIDVGDTGDGEHVWVVYTDFTTTGPGPLDFTASIFAARCDAALSSCTAPILISGADQDVQFGDVTIGPDGRTYLTWAEIKGELTGEPQTFVIKLRIAPAGSTAFGPTRIVQKEKRPLGFGGFLQGNDFRTATYPKNAVRIVGGVPRIYVVWDRCSFRPLGICEVPVINLRFSSDDGATWSRRKVLSAGGVNYFPTIADDPAGTGLAAAWYTNRFDPIFENRQDVELVALNSKGGVVSRQRVNDVSNETEADPLLGGFFIGDYFEVAAHAGTAYVHYNANYTQIPLLGVLGFSGVPIAQQDNYLSKRAL